MIRFRTSSLIPTLGTPLFAALLLSGCLGLPYSAGDPAHCTTPASPPSKYCCADPEAGGDTCKLQPGDTKNILCQGRYDKDITTQDFCNAANPSTYCLTGANGEKPVCKSFFACALNPHLMNCQPGGYNEVNRVMSNFLLVLSGICYTLYPEQQCQGATSTGLIDRGAGADAPRPVTVFGTMGSAPGWRRVGTLRGGELQLLPPAAGVGVGEIRLERWVAGLDSLDLALDLSSGRLYELSVAERQALERGAEPQVVLWQRTVDASEAAAWTSPARPASRDAIAARAVAPAPGLTEFPVPTAQAAPLGIAAGADGNLWFTENYGNKIGRITPAGQVTEFPLPTAEVFPVGLTPGPDGAIWFTEIASGQIGRITPAGAITHFTIPAAASESFSITAGEDGNLWFTELVGNMVGRLTPGGVITEFPLPTPLAQPGDITEGPDGNLWFVETYVDKIGRITPAGAITEFPLLASNVGLSYIEAGPDGNLWFTESYANKIGRMTPQGLVTEYAVPTAGANVFALTEGPDGALWFTENKVNQIGRITTAGEITEFALASPDSHPSGIAAGPDGTLWVTQGKTNQIARLRPGQAPGCAANATTLCISSQAGDNRFEVKLHYQTSQGGGLSGDGKAIPLASLGITRGGMFYFTDATNPEVLIKVLNGCGLNQKFWVFYAAGTNLGFTVTVRDTQTGATKTYTNADLHNADPKQDTSAFACAAADVAGAPANEEEVQAAGREVEELDAVRSLHPVSAGATVLDILFAPTAPAGVSTEPCYYYCFGNNCSGSGTVTLTKGLAPPFSLANLRKNSDGGCTGPPVAGLPVALNPGQALVFDLVFQPTHAGTFDDSLVLGDVTYAVTGTTNGSGVDVAFPATAVGSSSSKNCYYFCFGNQCTGSGTAVLRKALQAPFSLVNLRKTASSTGCTGAPVAGFPVSLGAGERLLIDFKFSPTQAGNFAKSLVLNNLSYDLSGAASGAPPLCVPDAHTLCIANRFRARLSYATSQGGGLSGQATAIPLTSLGVTRGGLFYFTDSTNPEMLFKILDGCVINQSSWAFFSATTNLGFTLTVEDLVVGGSKTYHNDDLRPAAPVNDTAAIACR